MKISVRCKSLTTHDTTPVSGSVRLEDKATGEQMDLVLRSPALLQTFAVGAEYDLSITPAK